MPPLTHTNPHIKSILFLFPLNLSPLVYISCFVTPAPVRIMRETPVLIPDAVSLKTAHSGVKFEILISKKPIQFRAHRVTGHPSFLRRRSLFLALFLSRPRSPCSPAWQWESAVQKPRTFQLMRPQDRSSSLSIAFFCLSFDSSLQLYAYRKFQLYL